MPVHLVLVIKLDESSPTFFHFFFPKLPSCPAQVFPAGGALLPLKTNKKTNKQKRPSVGKVSGRGSFRVLGPLHLLKTHSLGVEIKCYSGGAKKEKAAITAGFLIKTRRLTSFYLCPINPVYYTSSPHTSVNSCCLQESELLESRTQPGY